MGLTNSKITKVAKQENIEEASVPSSPISTPQTPRKNEFDPRSPSTHISRTPLELESFTIDENEINSGEVFYSPFKGDIVKYGIDPRSPTIAFLRTPIVLNTSKNNFLLDKSDDGVNMSNTTVLGFDPRSPTNEFVRTPIVVNALDNKLIKAVHNKNLDKVIQSEICLTPRNKNITPGPILLESNCIKPRPEAYKRKSFVGLLETNIDFTETDIDEILKEKCRIRENKRKESFSEVQSNESDEIFEEAVESLDDLNKVVDLIVEESRDEKCEVSNISKEASPEKKQKELEHAKSEIAIPNEIKSAPLTPRTTIVEEKHISQSKSAPVTPPIINITADVKELDKKLTNLIYEDQDIVVCPRIVQLKDVLKRSPLKSRNDAEPQIRKSGQKLKVSDKPRKSDYTVSKIPIFNTKGPKTKIQCENTPPRQFEKKKLDKKSHWDSNDVTLYL